MRGLLLAGMCMQTLCCGAEASLGPRLDRQYTGYVPQPTTAAEAREAGWLPAAGASCDDAVGTPWLYNPDQPGEFSRSHPVLLFFSAGGQISAISVAVLAEGIGLRPWFERMISLGYLSQLPQPNVYAITIGTRQGNALCDRRTTFSETVGTTLVINPSDLAQPIPLNHTAAASEGLHRGS